MRLKPLIAGVAIAATTLAMASCSSSSKPSGTGGTATGGSTSQAAGPIKVGVLSDLSGASASGFLTTEKGIKAYADAVNKTGGINGQQIQYVMADTASSAAGALTAAQKLVQSDKVFLIIEVSAFSFGAEPFLLKQKVPMIGGGFDGPIWNDPANTNLFDTVPITNYTDYAVAQGQFFKAQGVTKCGTLGYSDSKSSVDSIKAFNSSCKAAGLPVAFTQGVPFGSTDMGANAIRFKQSGADSIVYSTVPNTAFAMNAALRQLGATPKVSLLFTGYGGDLLQSPPAVQAAQGDYFQTVGFPAEANNAATQKRAAALTAVGVTGPPTFAEQHAYLAMTALAAGLKAAGNNPTRDSFMKAMSGITDFDAEGLQAPQKINFRDYRPKQVCLYIARLSGSSFTSLEGSPFCGATVPQS